MGILLEALAARRLLVSDGAWGTMLQARGMRPDDCPEEWNVSHAEAVRGIAAAYAAAGADMVLTDSFGGSRYKLAKKALGERVAELNTAAARNSLAAAPGLIVAGSVGPTGELVEPYGEAEEDELEAAFAEQIAALVAGGLRVICVETMMATEEAACAVRAAKQVDPGLDVIATMTFDPTPKGYRTMMGVTVARAAEALAEAGADVIGSNCGTGIAHMVQVAGEFHRVTGLPILIHANAGMPVLEGGHTVFRETPEEMAGQVAALVAAGARIVGGCCGTTPEHIRRIRQEIDRLRG